MKTHLTLPIICTLALLLAAFSTGSPIFLAAAVLIVLVVGFSFLGVWQAARTLEVHSDLSGRSVQRGESVMLTVTVKHRGIIPVAPMLLELYATPDTPETAVRLKDAPGRTQKLTLPFHAAHVGVSSPGVKSITVEDLYAVADGKCEYGCGDGVHFNDAGYRALAETVKKSIRDELTK